MSYRFTFTSDPAVVLAALKAPVAGLPPVRGMRAAVALRVLHCVLLVLGGLGIAYGAMHLITGVPALHPVLFFAGLALSYVAIFGSLWITLPVTIRRQLMARANRGPLTMEIDAAGIRTTADHFRSHIDWSGIDAVTRSKKGVILWFGGNRPSIPFTAFDGTAQIDAFVADAHTWMESTR
ncbi:YcxB family protein [Sulfitobacter albidus]|uniref:YcxB family protein n=1 Tax=Sulfitobacter albidus TaxID=2829501 RepID=A0A975JBV8_9RHOB|nr:YcxB family protein [Sulfitobacter albidus]QUJ75578.1 YcxB family protein [Sulfitobacter albidus]